MKTSVTLSWELLDAIDEATEGINRSALIEQATWSFIGARERADRERRELEAINRNVEALNAEDADVLQYQEGV